MKKYQITRLFVGGNLKGLTHTEVTSVHFEAGDRVYRGMGSPYKITAVTEINPA